MSKMYTEKSSNKKKMKNTNINQTTESIQNGTTYSTRSTINNT